MSPKKTTITERGKERKLTITEIKVGTNEITQECLAKLQQYQSDYALLGDKIRDTERKMSAILVRGGTVEKGPLRIGRSRGHIKIY